MSIHDHDPEYYMKKFRTNTDKEVKQQKTTAGYSEEEQIGAYIKVYGMAKNMGLKEFINWCAKEEYVFDKPININPVS